ncbi:hypothetical protein C7M84_018494 [Penaeus vannamei]|uniref:Uncharacterized protein n=1 Tax=Penaeus vannamei TaxID=6689 RepID=A0A423SHG2_PENVA|nr:hypothetical protein C7M84_018494 [Penaeus vannamei]
MSCLSSLLRANNLASRNVSSFIARDGIPLFFCPIVYKTQRGGNVSLLAHTRTDRDSGPIRGKAEPNRDKETDEFRINHGLVNPPPSSATCSTNAIKGTRPRSRPRHAPTPAHDTPNARLAHAYDTPRRPPSLTPTTRPQRPSTLTPTTRPNARPRSRPRHAPTPALAHAHDTARRPHAHATTRPNAALARSEPAAAYTSHLSKGCFASGDTYTHKTDVASTCSTNAIKGTRPRSRPRHAPTPAHDTPQRPPSLTPTTRPDARPPRPRHVRKRRPSTSRPRTPNARLAHAHDTPNARLAHAHDTPRRPPTLTPTTRPNAALARSETRGAYTSHLYDPSILPFFILSLPSLRPSSLPAFPSLFPISLFYQFPPHTSPPLLPPSQLSFIKSLPFLRRSSLLSLPSLLSISFHQFPPHLSPSFLPPSSLVLQTADKIIRSFPSLSYPFLSISFFHLFPTPSLPLLLPSFLIALPRNGKYDPSLLYLIPSFPTLFSLPAFPSPSLIYSLPHLLPLLPSFLPPPSLFLITANTTIRFFPSLSYPFLSISFFHQFPTPSLPLLPSFLPSSPIALPPNCKYDPSLLYLIPSFPSFFSLSAFPSLLSISLSHLFPTPSPPPPPPPSSFLPPSLIALPHNCKYDNSILPFFILSLPFHLLLSSISYPISPPPSFLPSSLPPPSLFLLTADANARRQQEGRFELRNRIPSSELGNGRSLVITI